MVLRIVIKLISGVILFMLIAFFFSCEEIIFVNCDECIDYEPLEIYLVFYLDENSRGSEISIYEGFVEDSILIQKFTSFSKEEYYKVPLNKTYAVTARYNIDEKTYIVVNSVTPRLKYEEDKCSDPCYYVYDRRVNLKLKRQ